LWPAGKDTAVPDAQDGPLLIRAASRTDEAALMVLAEQLATFDVPGWRTAEEIATADGHAMIDAIRAGEEDDEVFVAERDGAVVGCLHILAATDFFGRRHGHVSVIATTAAARGTGVGRALMAYAEAWTRQRRLTLLTLNVFAANTGPIRFYERDGFTAEIVKYLKVL